MTYNAKGQLVKKTENNRYNQLFTYDSLGRIVLSGYDVDGNGTLDLASMDRISEKVYHYLKDKNAQWWSYEYDCTYDGANSATRNTFKSSGTKQSGFSDGYVSEVRTTDLWRRLYPFNYDYAGHRLEKIATVSGTTTNTRYVYDGFKMIEELNGANSNALLRKYVWQQNSQWFDVPLAVTEGTTTRFYTTDANKNVSEVLNANGTVASHYEYSPFGQQTAATGTYTANLFRFSSEVFDPETTLVYYNYRYYNPILGRWTKRDPLGEQSSMALYAIVLNNAICRYDLLGLVDQNDRSYISLWTDLNDVIPGYDMIPGAPNRYLPSPPPARRPHYDRNLDNIEPPTMQSAEDAGYRKLPPYQSIFHQQGGATGNTKWISPSGHSEAVYDKDGNLVSDPVNRGTYNDYPPDQPIGHFFNDILPYWCFGNSKDDPTGIWDRITGGYDGPIPSVQKK